MDEAVMADARQRMVTWLLSDEAGKAARAELRRYGLDLYDPTDLLNDVALRVLQLDASTVVDNPVGYVRRAVTNRARDLLGAAKVRARHTAVLPHPQDEEDEGDPLRELADPAALDPSVLAAVGVVETLLRRRLQLAITATRAWVAAAAMSTLTLRLHGDVARPEGAPAPAAGSADQADRWAALWLAGQPSAFPGEDGTDAETAAMRKARSRKLQEVDALLTATAAEVLGGPADA
jgi:DNA-directed RNA polymerase specialized sigma24 family protein